MANIPLHDKTGKKVGDRELPLILALMPVLSKKHTNIERFSETSLEIPVGSGPYIITQVVPGQSLTLKRNPDYWARELNVRRGMFNFDRVTFKIYKDNTVQLEALKAGEFDYMQAFSAREWARSYSGRPFDRGLLTKENLKHGNAGDFQGFLLNSRRPHLADARVRQAIALTMDYEWMNRQFFYNQYERMRGYFTASSCLIFASRSGGAFHNSATRASTSLPLRKSTSSPRFARSAM